MSGEAISDRARAVCALPQAEQAMAASAWPIERRASKVWRHSRQ
jgi:hypothetical protein